MVPLHRLSLALELPPGAWRQGAHHPVEPLLQLARPALVVELRLPRLRFACRSLLLQHLAQDPVRETDLDVRDRALLLVGWQGALRRSEIVGLDWVDVRGVSGGCLLMLRGTKSGGDAPDHPIIRSLDPRACPVRALEAWRRRAERSGLVVAGPAPVFTSSGVRGGKLSPSRLASAWVGTILRKHAAAAGIPVEGWVAPLTGRRRLAAGPGRVFQRPAGACRGGRSADSVLLRPRRSRAAPTFPPPLLDHLCRVALIAA